MCVVYRIVSDVCVHEICQPYDSAIEEEHGELAAMYASMGAEKSDLIEEEDEFAHLRED